MESRVEMVTLGHKGDVSLDIRTLTQYSGEGKCGEVTCYDETADRYREEVMSWAARINWLDMEIDDYQITDSDIMYQIIRLSS